MMAHEDTTPDSDADSNTAEDAAVDDHSDIQETDDDREHFHDVEDGAGCTEIWEHLSDHRGDDDE